MKMSNENYQNKLVLIKEASMSKLYRDEKHRFFFCVDGFGCHPELRGSAIFGFHLSDGERVRWERSDIEKIVEITPDFQKRIDEVKIWLEGK